MLYYTFIHPHTIFQRCILFKSFDIIKFINATYYQLLYVKGTYIDKQNELKIKLFSKHYVHVH